MNNLTQFYGTAFRCACTTSQSVHYVYDFVSKKKKLGFLSCLTSPRALAAWKHNESCFPSRNPSCFRPSDRRAGCMNYDDDYYIALRGFLLQRRRLHRSPWTNWWIILTTLNYNISMETWMDGEGGAWLRINVTLVNGVGRSIDDLWVFCFYALALFGARWWSR